MNKNSSKNKQINPEILREREEKRRTQHLYDDDAGYDMMLFPDAFPMSNAASSTESTGLIQVIPITDDQLDAYDDVYSYRREKPIVGNDNK